MSHLFSPVLKSLTLLGLLMLFSQTLAMPSGGQASPRCIWYEQLGQIYSHMRLPRHYPDNPAKLVKSTCRLTMVYSLLRAHNSTDIPVQLKDNLKTYIEGLCHEIGVSSLNCDLEDFSSISSLPQFCWYETAYYMRGNAAEQLNLLSGEEDGSMCDPL